MSRVGGECRAIQGWLPMALEDLIKEHDSRKKDEHCPNCGTKGEPTGRAEIKCPAPPDECDVILWYP